MTEGYKFTWFDSKRSWGQFFSDLKFYIGYKSSSKELRPELARQKEWEDSDPIGKNIGTKQSHLIPNKTPTQTTNKRSRSGGKII